MKLFFFLFLCFTITSYQVSADDYDSFNHPFIQIIKNRMDKSASEKFRSKSKENKTDVKKKAAGNFITQVLCQITHFDFDKHDHLAHDTLNEQKPTIDDTVKFVEKYKDHIEQRILENIWESADVNYNQHKQIKFQDIEPHIQRFFEAFFCDNQPKPLIFESIKTITPESYVTFQ